MPDDNARRIPALELEHSTLNGSHYHDEDSREGSQVDDDRGADYGPPRKLLCRIFFGGNDGLHIATMVVTFVALLLPGGIDIIAVVVTFVALL
eukprot:CAMPEP_0196239154 /NCGR_PEP_ID=MMETSP0913-20130531/7575_1 /TAXON_ID=49265 /ORGANISM="Thalassiosira rotula, Strain GSO102" /LENGTH=92 /DNA_ID=CAMNT_0041521007 /DNA_START=1 /DNA_END=275 /DNA_ORIENTATION=-